MIKSGFGHLHFSNSNIGNIRHQKASKNYALFKNNKMIFLYPFFSHTTIILFQVAKRLEKRNWEMVLYFYFAFNRQVVYIENKSRKSRKGRSTKDYPLTLFVPTRLKVPQNLF